MAVLPVPRHRFNRHLLDIHPLLIIAPAALYEDGGTDGGKNGDELG